MIRPGIYLPADMDNNDSVDASESARIYLNSDRISSSSLNKIHARMMVQKLKQLLANSIYGFTTPNYHMENDLIMDYQKFTADSHCYEYSIQVYKRKAVHYQKIMANMRKVFNNTINEVGELL